MWRANIRWETFPFKNKKKWISAYESKKEVVDRIISKPNSKSYGRLSVICQIICNTYKCFDVSPKAFYPEPKIWSSIVRLTPKPNQPSKEIINQLWCHVWC